MTWARTEDVRPLHLQVAIRFAFSALPSLSQFNPTDRAVVCLHFRKPHLSQFYPLKEFLWKSPDFCGGKLNAIFLLREKCNLLIKLLSLNRGEGSNQ